MMGRQECYWNPLGFRCEMDLKRGSCIEGYVIVTCAF